MLYFISMSIKQSFKISMFLRNTTGYFGLVKVNQRKGNVALLSADYSAHLTDQTEIKIPRLDGINKTSQCAFHVSLH